MCSVAFLDDYSRCVVNLGLYLGKLVDLFNEHDLDSVSTLDARYADTLGSAPWVGKNTIAHIGKP